MQPPLPTSPNRHPALEDFQNARRKAALHDLIAKLRGKHTDLLSFEDVRTKLKAVQGAQGIRREIPLSAIIGSVGRYTDFDHHFLPRLASDKERWAGVYKAITGGKSLPPIDVYQVGEAYFVVDGNHRVSVTRELGLRDTITANIIEIKTKIPLTPNDHYEDVIRKAEYINFLEQTQLDEIRPEADLSVTQACQYPEMLQMIEIQRFLMQTDGANKISFEEAAAAWYDNNYYSVVEIIRGHKLLRDFPKRTETDLYVWLAKYRLELNEDLGWEISLDTAATALAEKFSDKNHKISDRIRHTLDVISHELLDTGPPTGFWRKEQISFKQGRMFSDVLVLLEGTQTAWAALDAAIHVAQNEGAQLYGLCVSPGQTLSPAEKEQTQVAFNVRCSDAGLSGRVSFSSKSFTQTISERARFADLVITNPLPDMRKSLQRCYTPVLVTHKPPTHFDRVLLAFDGGPKSQEAMYMGAYLAAFWGIELVVASIPERGFGPEVLSEAREYLESRGVEATYHERSGHPADAILELAVSGNCGTILIGSYRSRPILSTVLGKTVDQIIEQSEGNVLVCR